MFLKNCCWRLGQAEVEEMVGGWGYGLVLAVDNMGGF
jgi:hypothetical protein